MMRVQLKLYESPVHKENVLTIKLCPRDITTNFGNLIKVVRVTCTIFFEMYSVL